MKRLLLLFFFITSVAISAQDQDSLLYIKDNLEEFKDYNFKSFSMNMSPLLFELIPLKQSPTKSGPVELSYSWGFKEHAFRLGLGFNINTNGDRVSRALVRIGYENNRSLTPKFRYFTTYDFYLGGGGFNIPNREDNDSGIVGLSTGLGFQYYLHPLLFIGSETSLFLGVNDGFAIQVIPPVGVFLGIRI